MALNIKLLHGLAADLPTTKVDGRLLFVTDTGEIYFDINGDRIKLYETAIAAAKKAGTDASAALETYKTDVVGTPDTGKTVVAMIRALETEINGSGSGDDGDKTLSQRVADAEAAITTLNADANTEGSVEKTVSDAIAAIVASAPSDFDTLKEIADWIANDTTGAAKMANDIATLKGADTVEGSVAKSVKDAIEALDVTDTEVNDEYVSEVSQVDGKITVKRKALPSLSGLEWGTFTELNPGT